jgi:hypothetical protein
LRDSSQKFIQSHYLIQLTRPSRCRECPCNHPRNDDAIFSGAPNSRAVLSISFSAIENGRLVANSRAVDIKRRQRLTIQFFEVMSSRRERGLASDCTMNESDASPWTPAENHMRKQQVSEADRQSGRDFHGRKEREGRERTQRRWSTPSEEPEKERGRSS